MSLYRGRFSDSTILHTFRVLAVDRPGYGYSGLGHPEPSIQKQSEMISDLLDSVYKVTHPVIIVGGSFGAPIACRLAMDHPELVDGLVLTGPAIGPGREKYFGLHLLLKAHLSAGLFQEFLNRQTRKNYITKKNWKKCFRTGKIFVSRLCICREQRIIL
jgi:pimeloyl-ACP methyl ester carboxylesterase